jgi:hypothetical protein
VAVENDRKHVVCDYYSSPTAGSCCLRRARVAVDSSPAQSRCSTPPLIS